MLLSLTGVRSIIANQWYTTLQENAERLEILSESKYLCSSLFACISFQTFVCIHLWSAYLLVSHLSSFFAPHQILPGVSVGGKLNEGAAVLLKG